MCAALYPVIASTCNHSCDPNMVRATCDGDMILVAGRHVTRGEELSDMYTVHWADHPTADRIQYLERVFHFRCTCVACREDWQPSDYDNPGLEKRERSELCDERMKTESYLIRFILKHLSLYN